MHIFANRAIRDRSRHPAIAVRPRRRETNSAQDSPGQKAIGNQAVQRMLRSGTVQAKLVVNGPGDEYEREADRVAEQVMSMTEPAAPKQVQRACPECEEVQRQHQEEEEEKLQAKPDERVQRQTEPEEEEETVQKKGPGGGIVSRGLEAQIRSLRGVGQPLSPQVRSFFEPRFGHDFGQVRVHADAQAAEAARAVNALAFTVRDDIFFQDGVYDPYSSNRLIGHELAHVLQQKKDEMQGISSERAKNSAINIQKYGGNVHYDLTKASARSILGERNADKAEEIAQADQGLDTGPTHPTVSSLRQFFDPSIPGQNFLHFPERRVAIDAVENSIWSGNLADFGRALHRYQDSFSHSFPPGAPYNSDRLRRHDSLAEGIMYWEARRRGLVLLARTMFPDTSYGRGAVIRHLDLGNSPDDYGRNEVQFERDTEMRRGSERFLRELYIRWRNIKGQ